MQRMMVPFMIAALLLSVTPPARAQDGAEWRVGDVRSLYDVVMPVVGRPHYFPAPDGQQFAYGRRAAQDELADDVCTVHVAALPQICAQVSIEEYYTYSAHEFIPPLRWSPDSTRLAIVGSPYQFLYDTDLGVVNFVDGTFGSVADDAYQGNLFPYEKIPDGVTVDVQVAWAPDGTRVAVERTYISAAERLGRTMIAVVDAATGAELFAVPHPAADDEDVDAGTVLGMDWSPDGDTLALSVRGLRANNSGNGLWLLDLASGRMKRLLTYPQAAASLQPVAPNPGPAEPIFALAPIRWSPDSARLLVWNYDPRTTPPQQHPFWIDPVDGSINLLQLLQPEAREFESAVYSVSAAWSPDGSRLLVLARHANAPDSDTIIPLMGDVGDRVQSLHLVDPVTGESSLLGHLPFIPGQPFLGEWGADGSVIIGGYIVQMLR